jgi:alkylation response protein AidB-like acyl-CoA dehydrogenase
LGEEILGLASVGQFFGSRWIVQHRFAFSLTTLGYSCEFDAERLYRDAPLMIIGEGTNEMQRIIIAKQLIARNPA